MLRMKELRENLQSTAGRVHGREDELDIILMHSALDAWRLKKKTQLDSIFEKDRLEQNNHSS